MAPPYRGISQIPFMSRARGHRESPGGLVLHYCPLLALIGATQEGHDLSASAAVAGLKVEADVPLVTPFSTAQATASA